jgi:hypothetical protein
VNVTGADRRWFDVAEPAGFTSADAVISERDGRFVRHPKACARQLTNDEARRITSTSRDCPSCLGKRIAIEATAIQRLIQGSVVLNEALGNFASLGRRPRAYVIFFGRVSLGHCESADDNGDNNASQRIVCFDRPEPRRRELCELR